MGYVAKLGLRCSPSVTTGEPVSSKRCSVSRTAPSKRDSRASAEIRPAPNAAMPSISSLGRGILPTGSVGSVMPGNLSNLGRLTMRRVSTVPRLAALLALASAPLLAESIDPSLYGDLRWRLVGPFRGGWGTVAEGVPDDPSVYYFGNAAGGVWKTVDAGRTWAPIFDRAGSASVGAL